MTTQDQPPTRQPTGDSDSRPLLRLVNGNATAEELAALVTVLAAMRGDEQGGPRRPKPEWSAHPRKVRVTLRHGRGGWRSSGLPS
jgi:Acyl-CoA carboxylase epsilon subunit